MTIEQIKEKIACFSTHINEINNCEKESLQGKDANIYEIMYCNVTYAELIAELLKYYNENGWFSTDIKKNLGDTGFLLPTTKVVDILHIHPTLARSTLPLHQFEESQGPELQEFLKQKEVKEMILAIKLGQLSGEYILPENEEDKNIKKELICKLTSVAFYIWQAQKDNPSYQYDNQGEYETIKDMISLYETTEIPCQYKEQISNLFAKIEQTSKFSGQQSLSSIGQK